MYTFYHSGFIVYIVIYSRRIYVFLYRKYLFTVAGLAFLPGLQEVDQQTTALNETTMQPNTSRE